jgi:hypothetical protein
MRRLFYLLSTVTLLLATGIPCDFDSTVVLSHVEQHNNYKQPKQFNIPFAII